MSFQVFLYLLSQKNKSRSAVFNAILWQAPNPGLSNIFKGNQKVTEGGENRKRQDTVFSLY